jgi:hypothetical protein
MQEQGELSQGMRRFDRPREARTRGQYSSIRFAGNGKWRSMDKVQKPGSVIFSGYVLHVNLSFVGSYSIDTFQSTKNEYFSLFISRLIKGVE